MMSEQQKQQQQPVIPEQTQTQEQLQMLLRDTIKENKSLLSKNTKLESKYVELFKQQKGLKKDHSLFVSFLNKYFNSEPNSEAFRQLFQQCVIGQYEMSQLQKIAEQKDLPSKNRILQLEKLLQQIQKERKVEREGWGKDKQRLVLFEQKVKELKDVSNKEINAYLKEVDSLKRINKQQSDEISQLRTTLEQKHNELSKISKEKLKLEHHLNNIRKKEIAEELSPDKEKENEKLMNERNQFLSLRQQVESLMIKRDQLKRQLREKDDLLTAQKRRNEILESEIQKLKKIQAQLDQKYELVRQCSIEQLQNLILTHHYGQNSPAFDRGALLERQVKRQQRIPEMNGQSQQIQHQYLKNILIRYIKAETSGSFDQALMLLQIVGTILKLDNESSQALQTYKNKRRQWWYIKY